jgi:hypothetical protein
MSRTDHRRNDRVERHAVRAAPPVTAQRVLKVADPGRSSAQSHLQPSGSQPTRHFFQRVDAKLEAASCFGDVVPSLRDISIRRDQNELSRSTQNSSRA